MPVPSSPQPLAAAGSTGSAAPFKVVLAWLYAGIPLAWGVWEVAVKSLDLFTK